MMDAAALRAELEAEWAWRADELRFLRNQLGSLSDDAEKGIFRKSLVVMLYSHFEGFCKAAFSTYVTALNAEAPANLVATSALMAASLASVFGDLRHADRKSDAFRASAPDDTALHRYARDREFCERFHQVLGGNVRIEPEAVVDTESNLRPVVLQKILFRLGLDHTAVDAWKGSIGMLLGRRNAIAHGTERAGIDEATYAGLERTVSDVVERVTVMIFNAAATNAHLRRTPFGGLPPPPPP